MVIRVVVDRGGEGYCRAVMMGYPVCSINGTHCFNRNFSTACGRGYGSKYSL